MQFSIFSFISAPRLAKRRGTRLAATVALAVAGLAGATLAQVPNPQPGTEQPSQKNPAPRAGGDAQNRNRAHDDKYWGLTDANRRYYEAPFSRIPDPTTVARGNGRLVNDGWQFPRLASTDRSRQALDFGSELTTPLPFTTFAPNTVGAVYVGTAWASVAVPSTVFLGTNYQRTPAVPRTAFAANTITDTVTTVKWFPNIAGPENTLRRFAIRVYLPTPEPFPVDGSPASEVRIEDARYLVTYQTRNTSGTIVTNRRSLLRSQSGSGWVTLTDAAGQPLFFPMATEATVALLNLPANDRPRVELDNTTERTINATLGPPASAPYVIADQIQFVPASDYGEIKAPTTVTPIHGGRKVDTGQLGGLGAPYASTINQPAWTTEPSVSPLVSGTSFALLNDSINFINNPRDTDTIYTDPTLAFYQPLEPWNPSTLFQGPRSLIDDQTDTSPAGITAGLQNGVVPASRTNQQRYTDGAGNPIPLFSHMQVLVPRTEYVPDPSDSTGLATIAVGCVYGVDWTTGATLWRFPDRTYLPNVYRSTTAGPTLGTLQPGVFRDQYGNEVARAGLRNPNITGTTPTVPGIGASDRDGNGYISDDEVYIVGQGQNGSGAIEAGITIVPRIRTRGVNMKIPVYSDYNEGTNTGWNPYNAPALITGGSADTDTTPITDVINAPLGRYAGTDPNVFPAVETGIAVVAANNGVVYAIDPYGNNDNRYYNFRTVPTAVPATDTQNFGTYHPGSTNILWTFSAVAPVRRDNERIEDYNQRLKESVPATGAWGRSTPVLAYGKSDDDPALNRFDDEPRLFMGNSNGVLYALNPDAEAAQLVELPPNSGNFVLSGNLPFRKDNHQSIRTNRFDLRWWFETQGSITGAPAVSASVHPELPGGATANQKGVYVSSTDGRVYCVDWSGPVTKAGAHNNSLTYNGTAASAEALNDNFRFHNANPTRDFARADGEEGTIRPRWVFPSRYRDVDGGGNSELAPVVPADFSQAPGLGAYRVERQSRLAPINAAPSLLDFPFRDAAGNYSVRQYVAVVANDLNGNDAPITGRVYLLDQVGDRRDFSVKPTRRDVITPGAAGVAFGQPEDMYAPSDFTFSDATPAWTYRPVYPRYNAAGVLQATRLQNRPNQLITPTANGADDPTDVTLLGLPEKRTLPTLFVGGGAGRVFALDIDPLTGLFLRWRENIAVTQTQVPLPDSYTDGRNLPPNEPAARRLDPPNPVLAGINAGAYGTLNNRPPLVRTVSALNAQDVSSITVSGGPQQNRNHPFAGSTLPTAGPTVPGLPANDSPNFGFPGLPLVFGAATNPPPAGTVPITGIRPPYWTATNVGPPALTPPNFTGFDLVRLPSFDLFARFTNQDHDDPAATTRGSFADPTILTPGLSPAASPELNRAYQYPVLAVTTTDGSFTLISTELDGLDADPLNNSTTDKQGTDAEALMGWGLTNDLARFNETRPLLLSLRNPGGPGTQVALITNAYYGAMDPGFRNNVQKLATDPSAGFPYYPWNEPLNVGVVNNPPYGDPRPRFEPRSLYSGNAANADGPDLNSATGDGWPEIKADAHTGKTGLPLDLRGLFFDKKFASNDTANNTNDDGLLRLPAYSGIGEALLAAQRRLRTTPEGALLPDGTPDVPRDSSTGATSVYRTDPARLFPGTADVPAFLTSEADINPAGTNIAWLYVGGADGVFYAYTPNRFSVPGVGLQLSSGFGGGDPNPNRRNNEGLYGSPKILIVSEATFNALQTTGGRPTLAQSIQAAGQKPLYEYGEEVFAVVYDIGPTNFPLIDADGSTVVEESNGEAVFPTSLSIAFTPNGGNDARSNNAIAPVLVQVPVLPASATTRYPYDPLTATRPQDPALVNAPVSDRAIAFVRIPISTNFSASGISGGRRAGLSRNGSPLVGWTPGVLYTASVNGSAIPAGGATERAAIENQPPGIMIANPLAVQAFLLSSNNGSLATVADPTGTGQVYNGIGPFETTSGTADTKTKVATPADLAVADPVAFDPDRNAAQYSQALTNGNTIIRRDIDLYDSTGGVVNPNSRNTRLNLRQLAGAGAAATTEPKFYMPVAASAGMIDHGKTNSTDVTNSRRNLRIVNRSLQASLGKLRVEVRSDALFQSWPGERPNVRANDGTVPLFGVPNLPTRAATGNPRLTPLASGAYAMRPDGIINYLPWEQPVVASLAWERIAPTGGVLTALANASRDYPDIAAQFDGSSKSPVQVITSSGDVTKSSGTLAASIATGSVRRNQTLDATDPVTGNRIIQEWNYAGNNPNFTAAAARVQITVPAFQPANLVAMHSLTSAFEQPSAEENPGDGLTDGALQLPRISANPATSNPIARATADRALRVTGANTAVAGDSRTITPMGYAMRMRAYLDIDGDGRFDDTEPYRDFETWFGVPVDISMEQKAGPAELPGASAPAFAHGAGQQNGYLGYGLNTLTGRSVGFLPPFLQDATALAPVDPYNAFFQPLAIKSKSNVNLWNVRASQKTSPNPNGSGYTYFAMQSEKVNPRFGILAVEGDPLTTNPAGVMPNVVTSLDRKFDSAWDNLLKQATVPVGLFGFPGTNNNPLLVPVNGVGGQTRYDAYYAQLGGRHSLHKPAAGSSADTGTILSIPDVPTASLPPTNLGGTFLPPLSGQAPSVGVSVPLGTPSGTYSNKQSGTPLAFFEDHDTNAQYSSLPLAAGGPTTLFISAAGPLYSGQNVLHPGTIARNASPPNDPGAANVLLPLGSEGVLRQRIIGQNAGVNVLNYLPSTGTGFNIRVVVKEAPLTGGVADQALAVTGFAPSVISGLLPTIDNAPLFDVVNIAAGQPAQSVSSLAPAAYRTAGGNIVLFYNSNVAGTSGGRVPDARVGAPFRLFRSALAWNAAEGTWAANDTGAPINGANVFTQGDNGGQWFSAPAQSPAAQINSQYESNLSPFVMHDSRLGGGATNAQATLLMMNVIPTATGESQYIPYFARLDASGTPTAFTSLLPRTGDRRLDATLRRFTPRGVAVPGRAAFVTYYGGATGRNNLLYVPTETNAGGAITGAGLSEQILRLPVAVTSASDPMPVAHRLLSANGSGEEYVVDVYYTGVLRNGASADVCMSRYRVAGNGTGARLQPVDLPRQVNEKLAGTGSSFSAKHFGWYNRVDNTGNAPKIDVTKSTGGTVLLTVGPAGWQVDAASKLLYASTKPDGTPLTYTDPATGRTAPIIVYVDAAAGSVSFRGQTAPASQNAGIAVRATYVPLAYRVAATDAVESSTFGFMDRTAVESANPIDLNLAAGAPEFTLGGVFSGVKIRYHSWDGANGNGIDRQWLYWQRSGASSGLYYTTRRVGVDLVAQGELTRTNDITTNETIQLSETLNGNGHQTVLIDVTTVGGTGIPFEVDYTNGRVYTQSKYEGQQAVVRFSKFSKAAGASLPVSVTVILAPIDETTGASNSVVGQRVPMSQTANENQPYAFLDVYDGSGIARTTPVSSKDEYPTAGSDPALQPGKVWLFWSSGRSRTGLARVPDTTYQSYFNVPTGEAITANGYNLFWQTLAPNFNSPSFSGFP